ncbi:hypothetical protein BFJ63_vAg3277 [Fusarium oxysporum f. sp. narcissi]|uniref:Uncharacterized protein n=1 Tax=Fusarium oxysporum f. sp. narcissi TaxID=451672 RepID=A0A4Q2W330_FUSOX|nr:hypothetical protein BFJ63_vAg3277 [Fusarium oxysporum f. sp. narcissi]
MHEPTIQIITRPPEPLDAEPKPEPQVIWRDENGKIYFRNNPTLPILRYPNIKAVEKLDDAPDKCKSCTRECLVAIPNEEIEKEIRELELDVEKDFEVPEAKKPEPNIDIEMAKLANKKAKKANKKKNNKTKESKEDLLKEKAELTKEKVGLTRERAALVKALKVKKAEKIRAETPAKTTAKTIAEMKKLSEFISVRIKRYNRHDAPLSEKMTEEDLKYTIEKMYKHLPNSFVDWEYEEDVDVCRILDLPCYGKSFGKDIEDHLYGKEHLVSILPNPWIYCL